VHLKVLFGFLIELKKASSTCWGRASAAREKNWEAAMVIDLKLQFVGSSGSWALG
jgi:hypothetical protein